MSAARLSPRVRGLARVTPARTREGDPREIRDEILRFLREGPTTTRRIGVRIVLEPLKALLAEKAVERRPGRNGGWLWSLPSDVEETDGHTARRKG